MKLTQYSVPRLALAATAFGFLLGCDKLERTREEPPPVVHQAPVQTRPFEDGYAAGFEKGKAAAAPRAKLPSPDTVESQAAQEAGSSPDRNEKWQRGWAEGYLDGFREIATRKK